MADPTELLDRAAVGREVGTLAALVLLSTDNDIDKALALLVYFGEKHQPEGDDELDACSLAAQAIRDAVAMRGGVDV